MPMFDSYVALGKAIPNDKLISYWTDFRQSDKTIQMKKVRNEKLSKKVKRINLDH